MDVEYPYADGLSCSRLPSPKRQQAAAVQDVLVIVIILGGNLIVLETHNRLEPSRRHGLLELLRAAPFPVRADFYQSVMSRILMHIIQSREIAPLKRQMRLAEVLPQPSSARLVLATVQFLRRQTVQLLNHRTERLGSVHSRRTVRDQVIVIR